MDSNFPSFQRFAVLRTPRLALARVAAGAQSPLRKDAAREFERLWGRHAAGADADLRWGL